MNRYIVSALVENRAGTLSRVSGLFSRRAFNIDDLTVGVTEDASLSRMTIAIQGDDFVINQIVKQLEKLVDVIAVRKLDAASCVRRELLLVKVKIDATTLSSIREVARMFCTRFIDETDSSVIIEATGDESELEALLKALRVYGILEISRTGITALDRGSGVLYAL